MKSMIISVGGTPEPIVSSLLNHRPEYVCFFASQQSLDRIGEIKNQLKEKGLELKDYKVICDDAEDLVHCYEKALECTNRIAEQGVSSELVVVDYTGGTKSMTAALALATIGHGYNFSYVGGVERTKNGLGIVVTGTEIIKQGISPWQIFAVEEKKRISLFVSSFQYDAAISTIRETVDNLQSGEGEIWKGVSVLLEGYLAWDNFDHETALRRLSEGIKHLELCAKFGLDKPVENFVAETKVNFHDLNQIKEQTDFFGKLHPVLVRDLVSNARRRYLQNKYDDAVARLYRALEMVGQIDFEDATGYSTSNVAPEKLPDTIREEYIQRYHDSDKRTLKLPLYATFRALKEMNHPTGYKYFENEDTFKKILSARNNSIFAHGLHPVKKTTYEEFTKIIEELFVKGPLIEFPKLNW